MGIGPAEIGSARPILAGPQSFAADQEGRDLPPNILLAQSYSCSPRKTCSKTIRSCEEARWLFRNCSWGGRLDRDNDGIPCENLC
ncbi:excalibur calcium-binding domain-containing protein [Sulfitobacter sp. R18_1]|uniref:excalibur calcium-binding domain-containing protein n=1 Tax=Sulfitobacter sp. R18_1 TaxID=2821104 RepID=UPI001ADBD41D|nr:excalibur calcium-binding domain-containing protein [Sulfitobacter sp. R18_1]MBO9428562.1 excalibur calcium-binding domain-containing protein [Sulfitobacter sp. R18_1]